MPPTSTLPCIQIAMGLVPGNPPGWVEIVDEFCSVVAVDTTMQEFTEIEEVLIAVLRFQGRLRLYELSFLPFPRTPDAGLKDMSVLPHRLSPEHFLQSMTVRALVSKTGLRHLPELRQLQSTTPSSSLASLIRDMIQRQEELTNAETV